MRIQLAALAAASLFVLAVPRPPSGRALLQGIPLGDLVRPRPTQPIEQQVATTPRPEIPTQRNPAISQVSPSTTTPSMGAPSATPMPSTTTTPSSTATPSTTTAVPPTSGTESNLGTPSNTVTGTNNPGLNLSSPGLPQTPPSANTVGGVPTTPGTNGTPSTGSTGTTPNP